LKPDVSPGWRDCHSGRSRNDYLVRSLGLLTQALPGSPPRICMRVGAFLTTGTFNLVVKDRSALRLSGAFQPGIRCRTPVLVPPRSRQARTQRKTFSPYRAPSRTVNLGSRPEIQRISTAFPQGAQRPKRSWNVRETTRFRPLPECRFGTKAARKMNLKKDLLEVSAITRPLKPFEELCPRI
jgi:hypothetical protein